MPVAERYRYVYVNSDGTARELHPNERSYLETEFGPGDGGAPYVKCSYDERNGWGELSGYLERSCLPDGIDILEAPAEDPNRPLNQAEYIEWLRSKGMQVTQNSDGSVSVSKPKGET